MKLKNLSYMAGAAAALLLAATGCDDFLDQVPDNRVSITTPAQVTQLLVDAYSAGNHATICELSSDNIIDNTSPDENGIRYNLTSYGPQADEAFAWDDIVSGLNQDTPSYVWSNGYNAIAVCNYALKAIAELEAAGRGDEVQAQKGEALISRAYHHFILGNIFALPYAGPELSKSIPGLPYMKDIETEVKPQYDRGNLADFYDNIEQDIIDGLPLIRDDLHADVPKYHFTRASAYAFAARFYLFERRYDLAEQHANVALGSEAAPTAMRNFWKGVYSTTESLRQAWISVSDPGNLMLITTNSIYYRMIGSRYAHNRDAKNATLYSKGPTWAKGYNYHPCMDGKLYYRSQQEYGSIFGPMLEFFEYTDKIAGIGYVHHIRPEFTKEEVCLTRAEARIYMRKTAEAIADLRAWDRVRWTDLPVTSQPNCDLDINAINSFYRDSDPGYGIVRPVNIEQVCPAPNAAWAYSDDIDPLVQCVLHFRRMERLDMGDRWFDIRRCGIEITHAIGRSRVETLTVGDGRRALQIPADVLSAGFVANDRVPLSSSGGDATLSTDSYLQ